jgi:S-DNA-T family DNA segregation ATPase FtsK/SpoIIIE
MDSTAEKSSHNHPVTGMQRVLEASIVTSTLLSLYLLLALYSFNAGDGAWTQTASSAIAKNWMGHAGAYLADILFVSVGILAYSLPFLLAGLGYLLFKAHHRLRDIDFFTMGLRIIGFFLAAFGVLATASINFDDIHQAFSAGGIVGDIIATAMLPNFNFIGTTLLLVCFIATGLTLMTGIGWMQVIERLGGLVVASVVWCITKLKGLFKKSEIEEKNVEKIDEQPLLALEQILADYDPLLAVNTNTPETVASKAITSEHVQQPSAADEAPMLSTIDVPLNEHDEMPSFSAVNNDEDIDLTSYQRPSDTLETNVERTDNKPQHQSPSTAQLAQAIAAVQPKIVEIEHGQGTIDGLPPVKRSMTLMPPLELLDAPKRSANPIAQEDLDRVSRLVEAKLLDFNIIATVVDVFPGPVITRFELDLAPGIKVSKISGLSKDLARSLSALSVRVVEVIPGKSVIGIEIPNENREIVYLRENLASDKFSQSKSPLTMVLGKDIAGMPVVVDLGKMPHLLVAGTTGSGKSVGVNAMIVSLLYKSTPEDVRMIMIDPKMLELSVYEGIPHLLSEVVTDMKEAANALRWCVGEMERRYKLLSAVGVRNLAGYNAKVKAAIEAGEPLVDPLWKAGDSMDETAPLLEKLPSIVVIVDEFADMIMIVGKKVEELIARIAQKARAAGIHLILATQRPSVDVITGLIKANIPTRIAFQVSSRIDSRTILDQQGAEQLLGQGDMLYLPPGTGVPTRVHGAFVDDHEVHKVVADWKLRGGKPNYIEAISTGGDNESILLPGEAAQGDEENDEFYDDAVAFVTETRRGSISSVQRKFKIGYNRAARLIEQMEGCGVVSSPGHNGTREVLAPPAPKN